MPAPCTDADVRRALSTVAVKCSDATLLTRLAQAAAQLGLTAKAIATRYSAFTINRWGRGCTALPLHDRAALAQTALRAPLCGTPQPSTHALKQALPARHAPHPCGSRFQR
jgi:hypothetical protein